MNNPPAITPEIRAIIDGDVDDLAKAYLKLHEENTRLREIIASGRVVIHD